MIVAAVFSVLGALAAFIITYGEYLKHFPDKKRASKMALRTAMASFFFFMLLSVAMMTIIRLF